MRFRGIYTPVITPFREDGTIDGAVHDLKLLLQWQSAGILRVAMIHHVDKRLYLFTALKFNIVQMFLVDHRGLLARPQILKGVGPDVFCHLIGHATAGAAIVQSEHETGTFLGAAMNP